MTKHLLFCLITTLIVSSSAFAVKEGGGGDVVSQTFAHAINHLPEVIEAKGVKLFPEVDMNKLRAVVSDDTLRLEKSDGPIMVSGAPKDARNYPDLNLIKVDPDAIKKILVLPNADEKLSALAFHEVLGIMDLEGNDDYHISNRLLTSSNEFTECSSSKFEELAGTPTVTYLRLAYDYVRLYSHCTYGESTPPGGDCVFTTNPRSMGILAGNHILEDVEPTGNYTVLATHMYVQQGSKVTDIDISDRGMGWSKQTYSFSGGNLKIYWKKQVKNSDGLTLAPGSLELGSKKEKKVIPIFCKLSRQR